MTTIPIMSWYVDKLRTALVTTNENQRRNMKYNNKKRIKFKSEVKRKRMHLWCQHCVGSKSAEDVRHCGGDHVKATGRPCPYHQCRMGNKPVSDALYLNLCHECNCDGKNCRNHSKCLSQNCSLENLSKWSNSFKSKQNAHFICKSELPRQVRI